VSRKIAVLQPVASPWRAADLKENQFPEPPRSSPALVSLEKQSSEPLLPMPGSLPADLPTALPAVPLWELDISEVTGHNLEARGRETVNRMLGEGWRLLHIYTLRYREDGVWRERPMAILGRLPSRSEVAEMAQEDEGKGGQHENPAGRG